MFFDLFSRGRMNTDLISGETQPYLTPEEKRALREAEKAERAFRVAKGYEKERFWDKLGRKARTEEVSGYGAKVVGLMRRATRREREELARELNGHVADHALALEEAGQSPEGARQAAQAAMGEPGEIARALDAQLSPFWLWAGRLGRALALVFLCLLIVTLGARAWQWVRDRGVGAEVLVQETVIEVPVDWGEWYEATERA